MLTHAPSRRSALAFIGVPIMLVLGALVLARPSTTAEAVPPDCDTTYPDFVSKPTASGTLRVATINTDGGKFNGATTAERDAQLDDIAHVVACLEPDILMLSEVHRRNRYWPDFDMLNGIRNRAGNHGHNLTRIFRHACMLPNGQTPDNTKAWAGNGVMSTETTNSGPYSNGFLEANYDHFNGAKERSLSIPLPTDIPPDVSSGYPGGWGNSDSRCFANPDDVTRWRGRHRVVPAGVTHSNVEVFGVHLSPAPESADVRRDQLAELASQVEDFRSQVDLEIGSGSRPAVMAGDFNEDDCIFDGECAAGDGVAQIFSGQGWVNSTDHINVTTTVGEKLDHIFVRGLDPVQGSDQSHARAMQVNFLNHYIVYGDYEKS